MINLFVLALLLGGWLMAAGLWYQKYRLANPIKDSGEIERPCVTPEQVFLTLVENSPDTIARFDLDGCFLYVNPAFEKLLGCTLRQLRGKQPIQVDNLLQAAFLQSRIDAVIATGIADEFEQCLDVANNAVWRFAHIFPEFDGNGKIISVQMLTHDITALKEDQHNLRKSHDRLRRLAAIRNFEQEVERKQLAREVHEGIGQYLMALRMNLSMLSNCSDGEFAVRGERDSSCQEYISNMFENLEKSVQLVRKVTLALRPAVLDSGIVAALEWLANRIGDNIGHACDLSLPEDNARMDELTGLIIFRIAELVGDIIANTGEVDAVTLSLDQREGNAYFEMSVAGDSDTNTHLHNAFAINLTWLRQQVELLEGEVNLFDIPGRGIVIEAIMPFTDDLS